MFLNDPCHKYYHLFWIPVWFFLFIGAFFAGFFGGWPHYSHKSSEALQAIVDNLQTLPGYSKYLDPDSEYIQDGKLGQIIAEHEINLDPNRSKDYHSIKIKTKKEFGREIITKIT